MLHWRYVISDFKQIKATKAWLLTTTFMVVAPSIAQQHPPLSDRRVAYQLHVMLDSDTRKLHGNGTMSWRNPDGIPVDTLQFHLYLNAFRDEHSTFMREYGGAPARVIADSAWGWIQFDRLTTAEGTELSDSVFFLQPDDNNLYDATVAAVRLPAPVLSGDTVTLAVEFTAQLPHIIARTGYQERHDGQLFVMAAQWFPKFGVYEVPGQRYIPKDAPRGQWYTHQFHANSEFYADFGTYDITLDVPAGYVVGASGVRIHTAGSDGRRIERYIAEDVHDFAWTASPAFLEHTTTWRHVKLLLLLLPEHRGQAQRHFQAARVALETYDRMVGAYPYATLTLVDGLGASNGMEYPTLITCGTAYMAPAWVRLTELVIIHEFGHQYFYGMLASNEAEEAWLDEGINSYVETKVMDASYGVGSVVAFPALPLGGEEAHRLLYAKSGSARAPLFNTSWEYAGNSAYGIASYSKSATVLHTLEGYLGWSAMQQVLRLYYERWRFKHPTTRDFLEVVEEVAAEDLRWFFDQYVYGTAVVDYAAEDLQVLTDSSGAIVHVVRRNDGVFPQVVRAYFEDGTTQDQWWDGIALDTVLTFMHTTPVHHIRVDPDFVVTLDVNRLNNGISVAPSRAFASRGTLKLTMWMQFLLRVLEFLF